MTSFASITELLDAVRPFVEIRDGGLTVRDETGFRELALDRITYSAVFGADDVRSASRWLIWQAAQGIGALPASIHDFYMAGGRDEWRNRTTPAINLRGLVYDAARAVFRAAGANQTNQVIFEIARSEMGYTSQRPEEYATVLLAAALREGYQGPVFIQGDHFQINAKKYAQNPEAEVQGLRDLIVEALDAGFYNIDIDSSTIVDLSKPTIREQQEANCARTAELTAFIREREPAGVTVSVGGEIGEVGGKNSTVEDLEAFMDGYLASLAGYGTGQTGISKISVQTGTSHGGVVLPDGSIARVNVDFETLGTLSRAARERYGLGGAVQHGASTLPEEAFNRFAEANACEVHLATGFQNLILDSPAFPDDLRRDIAAYLTEHHADERKPDMTDAQFLYTTRKRAFGPFKQRMWDLPEETRHQIARELEDRFDLIFKRLNVAGSDDLIRRYVKTVGHDKAMPEVLRGAVLPSLGD